MTYRASLSLAALLVLPLACVKAPEPSRQDDDSSPGAQAKATDTKGDKADTAAPAAKPGSTELSPEELELIDSDPRALTPEQNRKRAYALRKQIMQNPDSPQAQALEEARLSALGGELTLEQINPDAAKAGADKGDADKGLIIELPEHLKNQDVTYAPRPAPTPAE